MVTGDSLVRQLELGSGAVYENAVVQRRRDMEPAPASGGDCNAWRLLLLVWRAKADPSKKNCQLP